MDLHPDDDFPIACRAFDELLRVDRSVHEPCAFILSPFAKASDPKVDLHFWDPSDASSINESIVRKTGSTFPHDALAGVRAALEPVNPLQDERAFRLVSQSLRLEIIYAQISKIIATLR
jgi:hypothetical protein